MNNHPNFEKTLEVAGAVRRLILAAYGEESCGDISESSSARSDIPAYWFTVKDKKGSGYSIEIIGPYAGADEDHVGFAPYDHL